MPDARILIVDDDEASAEAFRIRLADAGHTVFCTANGEEALLLLQREVVDLILTDFMMPAVNGLSLTQTVKSRSEWSDVQVLVCSNNADPQFRKKALDLGAVDYLSKADGSKAIVERVNALLASSDTQALSEELIDVLDRGSAVEGLPVAAREALAAARRLAESIRHSFTPV